MTISEKSAYLKGLMDGLKLSTETDEGKMIAAIVDLLGDLTRKVTDIEDTTIAISDELDEIEEDLDAIEDYILDEEDDEDDWDDYEDEDDDDLWDDDDDYEDYYKHLRKHYKKHSKHHDKHHDKHHKHHKHHYDGIFGRMALCLFFELILLSEHYLARYNLAI